MGKIRNLLDHPAFQKMDAGQKRYILGQLGVPSPAGEPLDTLLGRAEALAQSEDAGESSVIREAQRRNDPGFLSRVGSGLATAGKQAILPTVGSLAGGAVASRLGVPAPIGQAAGSTLGEAANQRLGISEPSTQQLVLAAGSPAAASGVARVAPSLGATMSREQLGSVARRIPGGTAALAEMAADDIRQLPRNIEGRTAALLGNDTIEGLFDVARTGSRASGSTGQAATVPLTATRQVAASLRHLEREAPPSVRLGGVYNKILDDISTLSKGGLAKKEVPLPVLDTFRRRVGALIGKSSDLNEEQAVFLRRVYGGFLEDIRTAANQGIPEAESLLRATQAARRDFAAQDLSALIEKTGFGAPRADGVPNTRIGPLLKEIQSIDRENPRRALRLFKESIDPDEFKAIKDTLEYWNERQGVLPTQAGVQHGSGPTMVVAGGAGALGTLATGTATGGAVASGTVLLTRRLLASFLVSERGRTLLRGLIDRDRTIDLTQLLSLAATQAGREALGADPISLGRQAIDELRAPGEQRLEAPPLQP